MVGMAVQIQRVDSVLGVTKEPSGDVRTGNWQEQGMNFQKGLTT
jgi:hypothetical protein